MNDKLICFKEPFGESIVIMEQPLREGEEIITNPIDSKTVDYIIFAFKTDKMDGMMLQQQVSYDGGRTWYDSEKNIVVGSMTPEVFGYQLFGNTPNSFDYPLGDMIRFRIAGKSGEQHVLLAMRGCRGK